MKSICQHRDSCARTDRLYVATAQPATVQLDGLYSNFVAPDSSVLVVNRLTRLDLYSLSDDNASLVLLHEIQINGTISAIASLDLPNQPTSTLLVLTTSLQLFALSYDPSLPAPHIQTTSTASLLHPAARLAELQTILVDPQGSCIVVHAYNGVLHVVPLFNPPPSSSGRKSSSASTKKAPTEPTAYKFDLDKVFDVRLPDLNVSSIAFVPPTNAAEAPTTPLPRNPTVAVLASSSSGSPTLSTYTLDLAPKSRQLTDGPLEKLELPDPGCEIIIPIVGGRGVVVVGESEIVWIGWAAGAEEEENEDSELAGKGKGKAKAKEEESPRRGKTNVGGNRVKCNIPVGHVVTWAPHPTSRDHFFLGDIYGKLAILSLIRTPSGKGIAKIDLKDLGDTSSPTAIVPLTPSLIYVTSRFADSQLVRLPSSLVPHFQQDDEDGMDVENEEEDEMELVASYPSLAPISDCCLVVGEGGGTSVVTCSGAYKGGSLRVVRSGVGLTELASLEIEGIRHVWSIKRGEDELLVLGFWTETRVVAFKTPGTKGASEEDPSEEEEEEEEEVEEVEVPLIEPSLQTVFAGNVRDLLVQVTSRSVRYGNGDDDGDEWVDEEGKKITLAAAVAGGEGLVVALDGGKISVLVEEGTKLVLKSSTVLSNEIASLSCASINSQSVAVVGLWTSQSVFILSLPSFAVLASQTLSTTFLIRSALISSFSSDDSSYLFVGVADGSLESWKVVADSDKLSLEEGKKVQLGTKPVELCTFGAGEVFVISDRPTIVSRAGERLRYSGVSLKDITAVAPFTSSFASNSLALGSPSGLQIGKIDEIQKVDIRTIALDDDEPRRIAYDSTTDTFAVVCVRRDIDRSNGEESRRGYVKLMNAVSYDLLVDLPLEPNEQGESVCVVRTAEGSTAFVVGTSREQTSESEPTSGRLLLIEPESSTDRSSFAIVGELKLGGCPYSLAYLSAGYVSVAVNSQVQVYSLQKHRQFLPVAKWSGAFVSLKLAAVSETSLLVADAMQSVTLLSFTKNPYSLTAVAQDYRANYMSAASALLRSGGETKEFIGAELDLNLFTVEKEDVTTARSMADEHALSPRGVFHLGEMVSQFCQGSFVPQYGDNSSGPQPRLVFATSAGSLGIVADVDAETSKALSDLERNMRHVVPSIGGLEQEQWRAYKPDGGQQIPSAGFLDGNFLELFSSLSKEAMQRVLDGGSEHEKLAMGSGDILRLVDELARLH